MLLGYSTVYLSSHACAHWAVGRMVGIDFDGYEVRVGTANPEQYPPVMRTAMALLPFGCARTFPSSRRAAGRRAKAAMFAAGDTSTTLGTIAIAAWMVRREVPAGRFFAPIVVG
jgi:hypothetical protein